MKATIRMFVMAGAVSVAVCGPVRAAVITWQSVQPITGDSNVSTLGRFERAYNFGAGAVTATEVNGVTFTPFYFSDGHGIDSTTVGTTTVSTSSGYAYLAGGDGYGYGSAAFANLTSPYQALLTSGVFDFHAGDQMILTLDGLTKGQAYLFQAWANDSRSWEGNTARAETLSGGGSGSDVLQYNDYNLGGLGQFVIGTFTADGPSETIIVSGDNPMLNAFELRMIPEPSLVVLLGVGGLLLWRAPRWA